MLFFMFNCIHYNVTTFLKKFFSTIKTYIFLNLLILIVSTNFFCGFNKYKLKVTFRSVYISSDLDDCDDPGVDCGDRNISCGRRGYWLDFQLFYRFYSEELLRFSLVVVEIFLIDLGSVYLDKVFQCQKLF